jgi:hypothetical protein
MGTCRGDPEVTQIQTPHGTKCDYGAGSLNRDREQCVAATLAVTRPLLWSSGSPKLPLQDSCSRGTPPSWTYLILNTRGSIVGTFVSPGILGNQQLSGHRTPALAGHPTLGYQNCPPEVPHTRVGVEGKSEGICKKEEPGGVGRGRDRGP